MKYSREDLGYLKIELIRDIVKIIGMLVMFVIGLIKSISIMLITSVLLGGFIVFQIIKIIIIIHKIKNGRE